MNTVQAKPNSLLEEIEALPDGPQIAAIFDFDGTVISGFSAVTFVREQIKRGDFSPQEFIRLASAMAAFGLGNMGFSAMMTATMQFMRGVEEDTYREFSEQVYTKHLARLIYPESRALVEAHQRKGHTVAIISSATPYQVEPAARDLDIEHVLCTELEIEDGKFTGKVIRPTCFGPGKVTAAEMLEKKYKFDLHDSYFYSDSDDDLQLLERVGNPVALNPGRKLAAIAYDRNWQTFRFTSRGRPSVSTWIRSIAATGSLIGSFAASLPIWAITGSKRSAQNFSYSLFADTASAIIGMDLRVKGEHNLWKQRPAVFVFNHQSKADVIVIASLLRKDISGVGKKEIKSVPVIGQIMQFAGTVFIDRKNAASAIEAMRPLVDAIKDDGRSVVMAPEGTRTVTPKIAPFKKGAFHLAMQAGVPIVPIVIRNTVDVAPKGDFVFRSATVDVEVLSPVDTSSWTRETLDQHVSDVRGMFLEALGQKSNDKTGSRIPEAKQVTAIKKRKKRKKVTSAAAGANGSGKKRKKKTAAKTRSRSSQKSRVKKSAGEISDGPGSEKSA